MKKWEILKRRSPWWRCGKIVEWKGKKSGKGTENNFVEKTEYKGDFSEDKKNGKGQQKYPDGTILITGSLYFVSEVRNMFVK